MTIFLSSHLLSEVELVATRMAVINRGELIAQGFVAELLDKEPMQYSIQVSPLDSAVELLGRAHVGSDPSGRGRQDRIARRARSCLGIKQVSRIESCRGFVLLSPSNTRRFLSEDHRRDL